MSGERYERDAQVLTDVVEALFRDLSWSTTRTPDWAKFRAAFRADAFLYPSARPVEQVALQTFIDRMENQRSNGNLKSLEEQPIAFDVRVFGNTALVYTSYEVRVNEGLPTRGANAFLFVKNDDTWLIGAMAWDNESDAAPLPPALQAR